MNENNLLQIFDHYIEKFEVFNDKKNCEYYKWQIANRFHIEMDNALDSDNADFPEKLRQVQKLTSNLIDNYTTPFYGLTKFAEHEPDTVREMFRRLFTDDGGNLKEREKKIHEFLDKSHALREKYYPESFLYKDDMHSVTGYLFLYDPDHNYLFKATHALKFADCIEFYDDWGSGNNVRLDVYYRMCEQLVEKAKNSKELMATDASRFVKGWGADPETLYPDPEKHILAFDLIYCCSAYGLFDGISFARPNSKERHLYDVMKKTALEKEEELQKAREWFNELEEAKKYVESVYSPGVEIDHSLYGKGVVNCREGKYITVIFSNGLEKKMDYLVVATNGMITVNIDGYHSMINGYRPLLKQESLITTTLSQAEKELAPYADYLD